MPRFVILAHSWPFLHWDLMLEEGSQLTSWRLLSEPGSGRQVPTESIPPHRVAYLDYTGEVSNNRGTVTNWDKGTYQIATQSADHLEIHFQGDRLNGLAVLKPPLGHGCISFS